MNATRDGITTSIDGTIIAVDGHSTIPPLSPEDAAYDGEEQQYRDYLADPAPHPVDYPPAPEPAKCPRCQRVIAEVGDGEPSHILPDGPQDSPWLGVELCVECSEEIDPTPSDNAVCAMDHEHCTETQCDLYASHCPHTNA